MLAKLFNPPFKIGWSISLEKIIDEYGAVQNFSGSLLTNSIIILIEL